MRIISTTAGYNGNNQSSTPLVLLLEMDETASFIAPSQASFNNDYESSMTMTSLLRPSKQMLRFSFDV